MVEKTKVQKRRFQIWCWELGVEKDDEYVTAYLPEQAAEDAADKWNVESDDGEFNVYVDGLCCIVTAKPSVECSSIRKHAGEESNGKKRLD